MSQPPPPSRITLRHDLRALPFLLPFLLVFVVFIGYPLFYSFWISIHRVSIYSDFYDLFGTMDYVGLDNYRKVFSDAEFWWSILLTVVYACLTIVPGIALSLALALLLNREGKGFNLLRTGFYLPNIFDVYIVGVIWLLIYNPSGGIFTRLMQFFGLENLTETGVLNNPYTTLPAIALAMILKNAGFGMILFLTSLANINQSIFEAADVDGASAWQKLIHIKIPLLRPIIFFLVVTGVMGALNAFSEIYAMTDDSGGSSIAIGGETLRSARISGYHLYKVFSQSQYGEAAAISFGLLAFALIISFLNFKILKPRD